MVDLIYLSLKSLLFCSYFQHMSLFFYSNFEREGLLDVELNSASNGFRKCIFFTDPATPKTRNTWKNGMMTQNDDRHTFDGPRYPKNKKYLKKRNDDVIIPFFQVFLVFGVAGPVKRMPSGYSLDAEFNSTSNELSQSKFE